MTAASSSYVLVVILCMYLLNASDALRSFPVATIGGPGGGEFCMFPFTYKGRSYDECTNRDNNEMPWCFVDEDDGPEQRWGNCLIECKLDVVGAFYAGHVSISKSGYQCQRWDSQEPHQHPYNDTATFPDSSLAEAANYCRNPNASPLGPWCLISEHNVLSEYCDIPRCDVTTCCDDQFKCANRSCISYSQRCDGCEDCADGSDELNCVQTTGGTGEGRYCYFPFTYGGASHDNCIRDDNGFQPWCYVDDDNAHHKRRWGNCVEGPVEPPGLVAC